MNHAQVERPTVITVICVLMALGAVVTVPMVFMAASQLPGWYTPFVLASAAVGLVCMVGLWTMRKWSVYLYTAMTLIGQVVLFSTGLWVAQSIIVPAIAIAVMFSQLGKMR